MMQVGNPFIEGLLSLIAAENPQLIAGAAQQLGIQAPTGTGGNEMFDLGALFAPAAGSTIIPDATGQGWDATVMPAAGGMGGGDIGQMLKGFKAPEQQKPIMNAGVSGAQKAPEIGGGAGRASTAMLMQLLQQAQPQQITQVPNLGALFGGR